MRRLRDPRLTLLIQYMVALLAVTSQAGTRPTATYRALDLGGTTFEVGMVQSAYSVLPAIIAVFVGRWVDRLGEIRS
jgi:MFS family permease